MAKASLTLAPTLAPTLDCVAVFCGSSPGRDPRHLALAKALGNAIAERGLRLVYGGGGLGLMGAVARAAHANGAPVLGIIPDVLREAEALLPNIEHDIVPDMHTRKIRMYAKADAFIILPGGIGTLEEAVEVLSWQRLNLHEKPILFLSDAGYWDGLVREFRNIIDEGFAAPQMADDILQATKVDQAFELIAERIANPLARQPLTLRDVSVEDLA
ncbi:TIGR00730 family Rossman fold protein [uncultured Algimonas sp.]|uniref:LOG family protein n=1 Tax=uncultured Algimonas sp. TaxID=1547920 RepID=UPI00260D457F|nr:TIGR00730 family Rossman fold protein [uncultured Algimonas sp.]